MAWCVTGLHRKPRCTAPLETGRNLQLTRYVGRPAKPSGGSWQYNRRRSTREWWARRCDAGRASRLSKGAASVALFVSAAPIAELATIRSQKGHIPVVIGIPNAPLEGSYSMHIVEVRRNGDGIAAEMNQMRDWLDAHRIESRLFQLNGVVLRVGFDSRGEATAFADAFDSRVLSENDARAALRA
jgi:hypothetical protein